jgi:hypothetical protein
MIGVPMANSNLITLFLLLIISYTILYFRGRKYLEHFDDKRFNPDGSPNENMVIYPPEKPYLLNEIDDLDDYELSQVFQNQGSKEASKKQISDAMTRYPLDWSTQGPNSQNFQENMVQYTKDTQYAAQPAPYSKKGLEASVPESTEEEERKILQTYQPKSSKDLLTYSVDDVKNLLDKVYDKKGLIPVINKSKQGENIWEVTEVKEKNPTIVWEDDTEQVMRQRGEEVIQVPYPARDLAAGMNPFSGPRERSGHSRNENPQWTPGVDRMFTPTYPVPAWN